MYIWLKKFSTIIIILLEKKNGDNLILSLGNDGKSSSKSKLTWWVHFQNGMKLLWRDLKEKFNFNERSNARRILKFSFARGKSFVARPIYIYPPIWKSIKASACKGTIKKMFAPYTLMASLCWKLEEFLFAPSNNKNPPIHSDRKGELFNICGGHQSQPPFNPPTWKKKFTADNCYFGSRMETGEIPQSPPSSASSWDNIAKFAGGCPPKERRAHLEEWTLLCEIKHKSDRSTSSGRTEIFQ